MTQPGARQHDLRDRLLRLARRLCDPDAGVSEEEGDDLCRQWNELCPHPCGTDVIFWPNELGLCRWDEVGSFEMTPEQMVDYVMAWEPRTVSMRVEQRSGGGSVVYYLYRLTAPDTPATQVVTPLDEKYERGDTVAVALKGVRLSDGSVVGTEFTHGPMSCGRILGLTTEAVGMWLTPSGDKSLGWGRLKGTK